MRRIYHLGCVDGKLPSIVRHKGIYPLLKPNNMCSLSTAPPTCIYHRAIQHKSHACMEGPLWRLWIEVQSDASRCCDSMEFHIRHVGVCIMIIYRAAIGRLTVDKKLPQLPKYEPDEDEWEVIENLTSVLEVPELSCLNWILWLILHSDTNRQHSSSLKTQLLSLLLSLQWTSLIAISIRSLNKV